MGSAFKLRPIHRKSHARIPDRIERIRGQNVPERIERIHRQHKSTNIWPNDRPDKKHAKQRKLTLAN